MLTLEKAEEIRKKKGMDWWKFSVFLGFSPTAYYKAFQRGRFTPWMAERISQRCGVKLDGKK